MKNKIILPLIAIIFLSSCANKFSLTKRKYTKGYYFASSKNNSSSKSEVDHKNGVVKNLQTKKVDLVVEPISNPEIISTNNNQPIIIANTPIKTNVNKHAGSNLTASADPKNNIAVKTAIKPVANKKDNVTNSQNKGGDADLNLVIMVILCLFPFINLIPVYLHDGKKFTLNFLITLLLDFTWILGVIYALLVIFDVVDLA
jgi:hypothetical protein